MSQTSPFMLSQAVELQRSSLLVGWIEDVAKLGPTVIDYLVRTLQAREFAEVDPTEFFGLGGVSVERDVAQFPEGKLYYHQGKMLVLLKSNAPRYDWFRFMDDLLALCQQLCRTDEVYTIGGMVSFTTHNTPRELVPIANSPTMKNILSQYDLPTAFDYETPPGQRPTLSTYMLWIARRRQIPGAGLWVTVPFYLVRSGDYEACRRVLQFLDARLGLGLDFSEIDSAVAQQRAKIADLMARVPEIDSYLNKLESHTALSQEESERLMRSFEELLERGG